MAGDIKDVSVEDNYFDFKCVGVVLVSRIIEFLFMSVVPDFLEIFRIF